MWVAAALAPKMHPPYGLQGNRRVRRAPCPQSPSTNLVTQKELEEAGGSQELLRPLREVGGVEADWIDSDVDARVGAPGFIWAPTQGKFRRHIRSYRL